MVTTPTLVYIVSKISDLTNARVAAAVLTQISVILSGLIASVVPSPWKCECIHVLCVRLKLYQMHQPHGLHVHVKPLCRCHYRLPTHDLRLRNKRAC